MGGVRVVRSVDTKARGWAGIDERAVLHTAEIEESYWVGRVVSRLVHIVEMNCWAGTSGLWLRPYVEPLAAALKS